MKGLINKNNAALLLWSGGIDSTSLLWAMLKTGYEVRTLTVTHPQVGAMDQQRAARQTIKTKIEKMGYKFQALEAQISHQPIGENSGPPFDVEPTGEDGGVIQPIIWLSAAMAYLRKTEDLYLGYIKSDCAIHYLQYLKTAFTNLAVVCGRQGELHVPFEWMNKADTIDLLQSAKLLKHAWYCENPTKNNRPCKLCSPCMTFATGMWQVNTKNAYNLKTK